MQLTQSGSFKPLSTRFAQLKAGKAAAQSWAEDSAEAFKTALADQYANPNPRRSSATEHLRRERKEKREPLVSRLEVVRTVTANSVSVVVGMPEGEGSMIAYVQEYGATVVVTEKMRGFMSANGMPLKASTKAIHIPARHPWRQSWEKVKPAALRQMPKF